MFKKFASFILVLTTVLFTNPAQADSHAQKLMNLSMNEIMFAQSMIPHHKQAIDISKLALKKSTNVEIRNLASSIIKAQNTEIKQMYYWLKVNNANMDMGHDMGMSGMLTETEIAKLAKLSGKNFDKSFLDLMIKHHQGALEMIQLLNASKNIEVKKMASEMKSVQSKEISFMKKLKANYSK